MIGIVATNKQNWVGKTSRKGTWPGLFATESQSIQSADWKLGQVAGSLSGSLVRILAEGQGGSIHKQFLESSSIRLVASVFLLCVS